MTYNTDKETQVFSLYFDHYVGDDEFTGLLKCVDQRKSEKILKCYHQEDAQRSLFAYLLSKYMISIYSGRGMNDIDLIYNEYGKPYTKEKHLYFNLSHSGDMVLGIIDTQEVGIDVEKISNINIDIARRFFTTNECKYIYAHQENIQFRFYEIWTQKESYLKAIGKGLNIPLRSFDVCQRMIFYNNKKFYPKKLPINELYIGALCSMKENVNFTIINYDIKEFLDALRMREDDAYIRI
ncbi:MAG: 4'-phosphopantetheinyl transferase superfamily protein [Anaerocolumna sp.]